MGRMKDEDDMFDDESEESPSSHLDSLLSILEDAEIEHIVKRNSSGKSIVLDNGVVLSFNHDESLDSISSEAK